MTALLRLRDIGAIPWVWFKSAGSPVSEPPPIYEIWVPDRLMAFLMGSNNVSDPIIGKSAANA